MARAATENFPVAARVLPRSIRQHLLALYGFFRLVDYAGDEAPGERDTLLDLLDVDLKRAYEGTPRLAQLRAVAPTVRECGIPRELLAKLIKANRQDQHVRRYQRFDDLLEYCRMSANPVGESVLYVFGQARPPLIRLSDKICTALQLLEHCQDVAEDFAQGRIYLPMEDLERFGCWEEDLLGGVAPAEWRRLIRFEVARASRLLAEGAPLVGQLSGLARVAVSGYVAGGRATIRAFIAADHDPLAREVYPEGSSQLGEWVRLFVFGGSR